MKHDPKSFGRRRLQIVTRAQRQARRAAWIALGFAAVFGGLGILCGITDEPAPGALAVLAFFTSLMVAAVAAMDA